MANYELMVILDPSLAEADMKSTMNTIGTILKDAGAKINKEDVWGDKKLAYKINGSETGHYVLFHIELNGEKIKDINGLLNLEKPVWRYMFVNQDA